MNKEPPALFSYAFRPFFLFNGIFAMLVIPLWIMTLHGAGLGVVTPLWHGHEMLVGFALATVAGFSLTAVANWTGRPAVHGAPLTWLVACWLAGRLAMVLAASLPPIAVAILDLSFPLLLCVLFGREVIGGHNRRNYPLLAILASMTVFNGVYHLGVNGVVAGGDRLAVHLLIHATLLLVAIIAGRIVPSFTANWLRLQGQQRLPANTLFIDRLAVSLTVLTGLAATFTPQSALTGVLALATALAHGVRLSQWQGFDTLSNPLLFVLHAAYAWLPVGYLLLGCAVFGWLFTPTAALHALTAGAIGSIVLAVTTRVALGHTGRPLKAARPTVMAYCLFMAGVLTRVAGPLTGVDYLWVMDVSTLFWVLAFAIFTWVYWPVLTRPGL